MTVRPSSDVHENLSGGRVQTAGSIDVMLKVITINDRRVHTRDVGI